MEANLNPHSNIGPASDKNMTQNTPHSTSDLLPLLVRFRHNHELTFRVKCRSCITCEALVVWVFLQPSTTRSFPAQYFWWGRRRRLLFELQTCLPSPWMYVFSSRYQDHNTVEAVIIRSWTWFHHVSVEGYGPLNQTIFTWQPFSHNTSGLGSSYAVMMLCCCVPSLTYRHHFNAF